MLNKNSHSKTDRDEIIIKWDTGEWRDCFHFNPQSMPDKNTERKMDPYAIRYRSYDVKWGVVNPSNALCAQIFNTKREAELYRRSRAHAYVVVRVVVTPLYTQSNKR